MPQRVLVSQPASSVVLRTVTSSPRRLSGVAAVIVQCVRMSHMLCGPNLTANSTQPLGKVGLTPIGADDTGSGHLPRSS